MTQAIENKEHKTYIYKKEQPVDKQTAQTTADKALSMLPTVTSSDSGKFLRVSSTGKWVAEAIASAEGASF